MSLRNGSALTAFLTLAALFPAANAWGARPAADPASFVDMSFPDGGEGRVFRGADVPFGMVMWGPAPNGYSLTFLSGAEMDSQYQRNLPVLPALGMPAPVSRLVNGIIPRPGSVDAAEPGYFRSRMRGSGIVTELTATARTGMGRFTFPASRRAADARVLFYLHRGANHAEVVGDREVRGTITRKGIRMHFVARFNRPFARFGTWRNVYTARGRRAGDRINGLYVGFDATGDRRVLMKIGLSWVSTGNAAGNLDAESPGWDFEAVRSRARADWNTKLSVVEIAGGTPAQERMLYTHLSQTLMHPNLSSDANGEYFGFDDRVHALPAGHEHYANYSGWDIYRTWAPLIALVLPREMSDMMQSLVDDGLQGGGLPIWPVENRETGVMAGGSSTPILAGAHAFGARGFDVERAFALMNRDESDPEARVQGIPERPYLRDYLRLGYVPYDRATYPGRVAVSTTVEYAIGELALSRFARALGHDEDSLRYQRLAGGWRNLFNPRTGYLQPRHADGSFTRLFDPDFCTLLMSFGYDEGNAHTWLFTPLHDLAGLFELLGGRDRAARLLDEHFTKLNDGSTMFFGPRFMPTVGKYAWIGNEPGFGAPWEYNWAGQPWKTQKLVRRELDEEFMRWYVGDEDLGAMSAWAVWASLGLYPEIAGEGGLAIASPLFPLARVHLGDGRTLEISAERETPDSVYVQSLRLGQSPYGRSWISLEELLASGAPSLSFRLGPEPNVDWAGERSEPPPSFGPR